MSHRFYSGQIFHKRFAPKIHQFLYDYFFLDIDIASMHTLQNSLLKLNNRGIVGFLSKDHFGIHTDFRDNAHGAAKTLGWDDKGTIRFLTLPRIFNFVFNPISLLIKLDEHDRPTHLLAEVHNYNDGRALYPVWLEKNGAGIYCGSSSKTMYVSPFMDYSGEYRFELEYTQERLRIDVILVKEETTLLMARFDGKSIDYSISAIRQILCRHTFLTLFVVTRTLYQSLRLKLKGLRWYSPRAQDQLKKELA